MTELEATLKPSILDSVLLLLILLLIAALSKPVMRKIRFPHAVFLVITGFGLGIISNWLYIHISIGWLSEITGNIAQFRLSSDAILFIFLPTLIFEFA